MYLKIRSSMYSEDLSNKSFSPFLKENYLQKDFDIEIYGNLIYIYGRK